MTPAPDPIKIPKSKQRSSSESALDYVNLLNDAVQAGFERLTAAQERTEVALIQLANQVKATNQTLGRISHSLNRQQAITEAQIANIAQLIGLCTALAGRQG